MKLIFQKRYEYRRKNQVIDIAPGEVYVIQNRLAEDLVNKCIARSYDQAAKALAQTETTRLPGDHINKPQNRSKQNACLSR